MGSAHADDYAISAIIPTCNRRPLLSVAIESVLSQSLPVHELIVVDDGSDDGTTEWLKRCYPRIILIRQSNHGVSHARNRAIEKASGQWIALLDSDDRWYPDKLAEQVSALRLSPGLRFCHCDEHWQRNGRRVNPRRKHRKYGGDVFAHCLPLCCISPSATLIHRSLFDQVGMFDESLPACEDYDLWLRICSCEEVLYVDKPLLEKRGGHEDQLSRRYPAMDLYRLQSLAKILRGNTLTRAQARQAETMFHEKFGIFCNGAGKRGRKEAVQAMHDQYADLLDQTRII
ncbi:MAG: glycosyltransferase [Granulosicoccus sp.]|nr:glycosyltransferase [Granulosicoccus sp.]